MLVFHFYDWYEAVPREDVLAGTNVRYHRLTLDVLLPGPTSLDQMEVDIIDDGKKIQLKYKPPQTYLNANRTAARIADNAIPIVPPAQQRVRQQAVRQAMGHMRATSRVQAHENALDLIREAQQELAFTLKLPFSVDNYLCNRDDYGREGLGQTIGINIYRHENDEMRNNQQHVWIMHIELTDKERPSTTPNKPRSYTYLGDFA